MKPATALIALGLSLMAIDASEQHHPLRRRLIRRQPCFHRKDSRMRDKSTDQPKQETKFFRLDITQPNGFVLTSTLMRVPFENSNPAGYFWETVSNQVATALATFDPPKNEGFRVEVNVRLSLENVETDRSIMFERLRPVS